jgi:hypothetical protein
LVTEVYGGIGKEEDNSRLYCDNESFIHLSKNLAFHLKTKHIHLRYHFIQSVLEDGHLKLEKIHTSQNPADMLTKGVSTESNISHNYCTITIIIKHLI